jgi:hypothetical protein
MVEIYNASDAVIMLGTSAPDDSIGLSDTLAVPPTHAGDKVLWTFREGVVIQPRGCVIVFCDENAAQDYCEPHANFEIASDGSEPISLWGPEKPDGTRDLIDQVWLPPLPPDVSFGRYPDGAGPAPVPLEDVLNTFFYNPPGPEGPTATFGSCVPGGVPCAGGQKRFCLGKTNSSGANLNPRVDAIIEFSTNGPRAVESVRLVVKVEDDKNPLPPNITSVRMLYRVDGGPDNAVDMTYDAAKGIVHKELLDYLGNVIGENPFNQRTFWHAEIPGQPAGARVEFSFETSDADGGTDTSPEVICADGVGPCDHEFGGPGCALDPDDRVVCDEDGGEVIRQGIRYIECKKRFSYVSGYVPAETLKSLVINEVVAEQTGVLRDPTEVITKRCDDGTFLCRYDDFIELHNNSTDPMDLSGLWLSDHPFRPQGWQFPAGSGIEGGEHLIVWIDSDGGRCPEVPPPHGGEPCFWDCPDPTNASMGVFHTSFSLRTDADHIYLLDREENGFGIIHGVSFVGLPVDSSLALIPDGDRDGCWIVSSAPTVDPGTWRGLPNVGKCRGPEFLRGDANSDCRVDITDGIYILSWLFTGGKKPTCLDAADTNDTGVIDISDGIFVLGYLFLGSAAPPAPGPKPPPGQDATESDALEECLPPSC